MYENAMLLKLMKHRHMRSQSKTVLYGIVYEACEVFSTPLLLKLMKHRHMQSQSTTVLYGIVYEAYTEYSAQQEILNAEEL